MEQTNNTFRNLIFVVAVVAGAGLIIYGAVFYTKAPQKEQKAQIAAGLSQQESAIAEESVLGNPNAPVTIIEYASHLCGHCLVFGKNTFPKIKEGYIETGKVKFIYRSFPPLEIGMALACAQEQNKFWEYNHYLLDQRITAPEDLAKFAGEIGLNREEFNKCLESLKYQSVAAGWYQQGQNDGVEGTPTFFINGTKLVGNQPYEEFVRIIEEELAK